jgi:hypothetical protein
MPCWQVLQWTTHSTDILIDGRYALVRAGLEQLAGHELLERQYNAVFAAYAYRCAAILYRLDCVFDLENPSAFIRFAPRRELLA